MNHSEISSFIWGTADLLRSSFKQHEYGDIILPFTVMRRLDVVLERLSADPFVLRVGDYFQQAEHRDYPLRASVATTLF